MKKRYLVRGFLKDFDWAVKDFYRPKGRGFEQFLHGASVHFHGRLIEVVRRRRGEPSRWISEEPYFVELLYAMLASWGMDSGQARLLDFEKFDHAIRLLVDSEALQRFQGVKIAAVDAGWRGSITELWRILTGPGKVMASRSQLVGASKVLHHLLPDVFPPIDGTYTLDFLSSLEITEPFTIKASELQPPGLGAFFKAMLFFGMAARTVPNLDRYLDKGPMSGSIPKVIDNAIIAWWGSE
jgi:hypothetical protein